MFLFLLYCSNFIHQTVNCVYAGNSFITKFTSQFLPTLSTRSVFHTSAMRHAVVMRYATSRKVAGSRPDEVNEFFSIYLILPAALGPGVHSASNTIEY
jgi:hypothetical protein